MKTLGLLTLSSIVVFAAAAAVRAKDANSDSVVKIHVTQRLPDFGRPWTKADPRKNAASGVVIAGRRILTNAHVVQYASQIFVQSDQSTEKIPARLVAMAPGIDLAVITVDDELFFEGRPALPLAARIPSIRDELTCYGYPIGGEQLSATEGIISRIEYASFYFETLGVRIQVDAALNPGNSGGPAVSNGQIVGLVYSVLQRAENIGYLVAAGEIALFLADIEDGTYDGKPQMFDELQSVEHEALRARLGLKNGVGGVMVNRPDRDDDSYPLKPWDVITHIADRPIDSQGNVRIKDDLRLGFPCFISRSTRNGKVPLTIFRQGESIDVQVPVRWSPNRLMPYLMGEYPSHFILGPMVFTGATADLSARVSMLPGEFFGVSRSPLLSRRFDRPAFEGEQLVVLGPRLFPHRTSKGYGGASFGVVEQVNDVKVKNLPHLVELLRDATGEFLTLKLAGKYETLVFRRQEVLDSTEEILENEGIREQYSDDLAEVWNGEG